MRLSLGLALSLGLPPSLAARQTAALDHSRQFLATPTGGRIVLQRDLDDSARVAEIRDHLRQLARLFAAGDFRLPPGTGSVSAPGTRVMGRKGEQISYLAQPLPRGGAVVIQGRDAPAIAAIHAFLEFHRQKQASRGS